MRVIRYVPGLLAIALVACGGGRTVPPLPQSGPSTAPASAFKVPQRLNLPVPPPPPNFTPKRLAAGVKPATVRRPADASTAAFFQGATYLSNGVYWLQLPNGNPFGYYAYIPGAPDYIYHFDMGYEYVVDANDGKGGVYFYDFASSHWWYTGRQYPFPYIYDFSLNHFIYYYPNAGTTDHYTTNPRYFYDFGASEIITLPTAFGVSGVAASGAPIVGATVTLKDSTGATRTGVTGSDGSYAIDTTTMTAPYFLATSTSTGTKLYSVSAASSALQTVNVTPLTDVATRMWYDVQSIAIDSAFASPTGANAAPSAANVSVLTGIVNPIVQLWLQKAGIATSGFNPFSTTFAANGSGVDHVLSQTTVNQSQHTLQIKDSATTQNTSLAYSGGSVTVATTTTNASGTTTSTTTTVIPATATQQSDQSAIVAQLNAFAQTVNTKGSGLQASDLQPYMDPNLLQDGLTEAQYAAQLTSQLAGAQIAFGSAQFKSLDTTANTADVIVTASFSANGQTNSQQVEWFFKKISGAWLITGDRYPGSLSLSAEARTNQGTFAPGGSNSANYNGPDINVDVQTPQGKISAVSITGGSIWNSTALQQGATVVQSSGNLDHYFINSGLLANTPPAGTPFTLSFTGSGNPPSLTLPLNAASTELIQITQPTGSTLASANLGSPLTIVWTLPTTYAIAKLQVSALAFTGPQSSSSTLQCETDAQNLTASTTTATITIPPTCSGHAVVEVDLNVGVNGIDGERAQVVYGMQ